jgi:hypothetical protein
VSTVDFASTASTAQLSQETSVRHASGSSDSTGLDQKFVISVGDILQILACLNNLICANAEDSEKVRTHARLVEEKLDRLGELMRPMLWGLTEENGHAP